jgi:hypothetical protein
VARQQMFVTSAVTASVVAFGLGMIDQETPG